MEGQVSEAQSAFSTKWYLEHVFIKFLEDATDTMLARELINQRLIWVGQPWEHWIVIVFHEALQKLAICDMLLLARRYVVACHDDTLWIKT